MNTEQPIYDLFLSYAKPDEDWASDWLLPGLEAAGLRVLTPDDFDLGVAELVNLERAVTRSRHTLLVLTPAWGADPWRAFEALLVQIQDPAGLLYRRTLPLLLQPCTPPRRLAMLSYADFTEPAQQEAQLARVVAAVRGELRLPEVGPPLARLLGPSVSACYQLRAPVGDFVGRTDEIDRLVSALSVATGDAAAIGGVRGMGGIGKTELAYVVANRIAPAYPDAQFLVELRGASRNPLTPQQALQTVIRVFEPEARLPDELGQLQALYRSLFTGRRALILADDAKDAAQVRPLLPPAGCTLLVTSRNHFSLPGMEAINLGTLPPAEAAVLLLDICSRIGDHATTLAKLCGYLALALRVSASLLANSSRSVARYLEELNAERLKHLSDPDTPDDPQASVEASLHLSYAALEPAAQLALCQLSIFPTSFDQAAALAVLAAAGDAEALFELLLSVLPTSFDDAAALAGLEVAGNAEALLDLLQRRSLLDQDARSERLHLHDLVRAFAAARLEVAEGVRLRYVRHYKQVADRARKLYHQGGAPLLAGLALFDRERTHIDAGWSWTMAHAGNQDADALLLDYANATASIGDLRYDKRRERIPQLEAHLAAAQRLEHRSQEGMALGNLGLAYADLGDARQAIPFYEQALVIDRELGDRQGEGASLNNLGNAYANLGDARQAITFLEQCLEIARELGDRRGEGQALGNLGSAYAELGDVRKAIPFYEQALVIDREIGHRPSEGVALNNLGSAYAALGNVRQAITFYEQCLEIARELGDRRTERNALSGLGIAYANLGDARKAITFLEQDLDVARELGDRRGEAMASWNLGEVLGKQGDLARAAELMQVYVDFEREIGHPNAEKDVARLEEIHQRLAGSNKSAGGRAGWWRRLTGRG